MTQKAVYVVDTSYLLELYAVPTFSEKAAIAAVRERFRMASEARNALLVPFACLWETGNHIATIRDPASRTRWAELLKNEVANALSPARQGPYVVVGAPPLEQLDALLARWADKHVRDGRGLVDAATVETACQQKLKYTTQRRVHIWTRDRALKNMEPDQESDPFV